MLNSLNDEQQAAITSDSSAIAIVAGPGTGKTKTLVARIEYLINQRKISAKSLLALTFTRKAAAEMKDRLEVKDRPFVGTFHSLALQLLKIEPKFITDKQQKEIVNRNELTQISLAKSSFIENDLVKKYDEKLKEMDVIDYDDLLIMLYHKLKNGELKTQYKHILVDEFQDTNPLQYAILKLLSADNYFVIGDPKQSIYSFRGTNKNIFDQFYMDFPDTTKITLKNNYRSAAKIINIYTALFKDEIEIKPSLEIDAEAYHMQFNDEYKEADWIVNYIKSYVGGLDLRAAVDAQGSFSDIAILYRTHRLKNILQRRFSDSGIPYQIIGEGSIYSREDVEEVIKKVLENKGQNTKVSELTKSICVELSIEKETVDQLLSFIIRFDVYANSIERFLQYIDQLKDREYYDPNANLVTLLTMHASKGLEFEQVIICGCEDGLVPSLRGEVEEEKRLLYVAMSRAKKGLMITTVEKRKNRPTKASPFLSLLSEDLLPRRKDELSERAKWLLKKKKLKKSQLGLF